MEQLKKEVGLEEVSDEDDSCALSSEGAPTLQWKPASVATM